MRTARIAGIFGMSVKRPINVKLGRRRVVRRLLLSALWLLNHRLPTARFEIQNRIPAVKIGSRRAAETDDN